MIRRRLPTIEAIRELHRDDNYRNREDFGDETIHSAVGAITVLLAEIDRLGERGEQAAAPPWQPIETAPKGTSALLYSAEWRGCSLCGDVDGRLFLRARCHPSAPLLVSKEDNVLILTCYLPDCGREVARLQLAELDAPRG